MSVDLCANPCDDDLPKAREFEKQSERMDSSDGIDKGELKSTYCTVPFDLERVQVRQLRQHPGRYSALQIFRD